MYGIFSRFKQSRSGTAAIEFAIIAPVLLAMFAGVVETGRLFQVHNATNRIATQYAIVWADCSDRPVGTCNTELSSLSSPNVISNIVPQLQTNLLSLQVFQVSMSGSTPTVVYASPSGATLSAAQVTAAQGILANGNSGVVVTATYNHTLQFFQSLMSNSLSSALTSSFTAVQLKG